MKLGIKREKFGDITIHKNFTQIIVLKEIADYMLDNLKELTRFRRCELEIIDIDEFVNIENEFEEFSVIISSNRLDNFVSELAKCSI